MQETGKEARKKLRGQTGQSGESVGTERIPVRSYPRTRTHSTHARTSHISFIVITIYPYLSYFQAMI